jgi:flavin-dependent dehydrogenase
MTGAEIDVCVIGGGPAGAAAALTLRRHSALSVTVVERTAYAEARYGETVPPSVQPLLRYLDVWESFLRQGHLPAYGTTAAWGGPQAAAQDFLFTGRGDGWHLDRRRFDRLLAEEAAARGASVRTATRLERCARAPGAGWRVGLLAEGGERSELTARFLIDASGKRGALARRLGARRLVYDLLVGVARFYDLPAACRAQHALVEAAADGWWYSAPLPDGGAVAMFFSDSDLVRRLGLLDETAWESLLAAAPLTRESLAAGRRRSPLRLVPAPSQRLVEIAGPGWIAAGDAACSFDPLASMGIGHAIASGIHAARVAHDILTADGALLAQYARGVDRNGSQYLDTRERYYSLEPRFAGRPFWARRQGAHPAAAPCQTH